MKKKLSSNAVAVTLKEYLRKSPKYEKMLKAGKTLIIKKRRGGEVLLTKRGVSSLSESERAKFRRKLELDLAKIEGAAK